MMQHRRRVESAVGAGLFPIQVRCRCRFSLLVVGCCCSVCFRRKQSINRKSEIISHIDNEQAVINHACVPNIEFRYNTLRAEVDVVAAVPIAADDELVCRCRLMCYVGFGLRVGLFVAVRFVTERFRVSNS
jgi:hypothetical protein